MMKFKLKAIAITAAGLFAGTALWAQNVKSHQQHAPADSSGGTTARAVNMEVKNSTSAAQDKSGDSMAGMDHGSMGDAQGGSAPADARDPHAYSGGYGLGVGKYAYAQTRQLKLADEHNFAALLANRFERANSSYGNTFSYGAQAWFGRDYDKLVIKAEGDLVESKVPEARTEVLWGHAFAPFWDTQLGLRSDSGAGPERRWLAVGVQGLAPYWFGVEATAYLGEGGKTALRLSADYDILLTQRLILQPGAEFNFYGQRDPERGLGDGLSNATAGVRLRYEFSRQFAPYLGVEWKGKYGSTADVARDAGEPVQEVRWIGGVRFWF